jgi:NAD(P)-dependent dehydrogenase (short-subunit alcohol dehydrogenase family)
MQPQPGGPFQNRSALILGGTSGIGRAAFDSLKNHGCRCIAIGKPDAIQSAEVSNDFIFADLTSPSTFQPAFDQALQSLGGHIDILIHSVGGSARSSGDGPLSDCTLEGFQAALKLNLESAFLALQAAVRQMQNQPPDAHNQRGCIALVGSVLATSPSIKHFNTIGYSAAKAALEALVRTSAATHAADGIRINLLKPGLVATPMAERALHNPEILEFLSHKQPLTHGPLSAQACAQALLSLVHPDNIGLTGSILTLDGGWSIT